MAHRKKNDSKGNPEKPQSISSRVQARRRPGEVKPEELDEGQGSVLTGKLA